MAAQDLAAAEKPRQSGLFSFWRPLWVSIDSDAVPASRPDGHQRAAKAHGRRGVHHGPDGHRPTR
jgi:hypothetical protein